MDKLKSNCMSEFNLSTDTTFVIRNISRIHSLKSLVSALLHPRALLNRLLASRSMSPWIETVHTTPSRLGLVLLAGNESVFPNVKVGENYRLFICFGSGLPEISKDGLGVIIKFLEINKEPRAIWSYHLPSATVGATFLELEIDIGFLCNCVGRFSVECNPGPESDPRADWLAVYELVGCHSKRVSLMRARAFQDIRIKNELAHFEHVYSHDMYKSDTKPEIALPKLNPYNFAHELMRKGVAKNPPDFHKRFAEKAVGANFQVLSLCCGAARFEASFAQTTTAAIEITLFDLNEKLLVDAKSKFPGNCTVETVCGNINDISGWGKKYDVIICISALHHVVELEKLFCFIDSALKPEGEFWVIGEYIGKNGNRLWPEAYTVANNYFKSLPEKYRINHCAYGTPQVDSELPNVDCSIKTFEGIRSQDIEGCLSDYFEEVYSLKEDCFLWRLFDLSYYENFTEDNEDVKNYIREAVSLELQFYNAGGKPTTLNGIYKAKRR